MNGQLKKSGKSTTRILAMVLATAACAGSLTLHAPVRAMAADACTDSSAGLVLGTGADTYLSEQIDQSTMKDDALKGLTTWRQDALDSNEKLWNGQTVKDYLSANGISEDTYLHPSWSTDLERIAIQRSAEANVAWDHTRPNGESWNRVTTASGAVSQGEALAKAAMPAALNEWGAEKQTLIDQSATGTSQADDYLFLINPTYQSYGFAAANGNAGIGEASTSASSGTSAVGWSGVCSFHIPTLANDLTPRMSPSTAVVGQTKNLITSVTGTWKGWFTPQQQTTLVLRGTYVSDAPEVASIAGSTLTANDMGTAGISMSSGDQTVPLGEFQVTLGTIASVEDAAVTTPSGTIPSLPNTARVTWTTGGTTSAAVTWGTIPTTWRNRAGGQFTVTGTVYGGRRTLKAVVTVTPAVPKSVAAVTATTVAGTAPKLPAKVQLTWSNGDVTSESVTWSAIPASSYARAGTFKVAGKVSAGGTTIAASATVTVKGAPGGFTPMSGSGPKATSMLGEATGDKLADVWAIDRSGTLDFYRSTTAGLVKIGVRGTQLGDLSCLTPISDQNHDGRADLLYRRTSDGSVWIAYSLGNGYLKQGPRVATNWKSIDQIAYAGRMVAGSTTEYVLARRSSDSTLWRYTLSSKGLTNGVLMARKWGNMRAVVSAGNMWGDASWDVVAIANDGNMYGYLTRNGRLSGVGRIGHGWVGMNAVFVPGDLTGDGRLDLMSERTNGSLWAYRNTGSGWVSLGQRASRFAYRVLG